MNFNEILFKMQDYKIGEFFKHKMAEWQIWEEI